MKAWLISANNAIVELDEQYKSLCRRAHQRAKEAVLRRRKLSAFDPLDMGRRLIAMRRRRFSPTRTNKNVGLDLKGGTHLILQVMVNDAVNADSDQVIERLKDGLRQKNVSYAEISKPDPANNPDRIVIKGLAPTGSAICALLCTSACPTTTIPPMWAAPTRSPMKQQPLLAAQEPGGGAGH